MKYEEKVRFNHPLEDNLNENEDHGARSDCCEQALVRDY